MAGAKNDDMLFVCSQRLKKFISALKMTLMTTQVTTGNRNSRYAMAVRCDGVKLIDCNIKL